MQQKLMLAFGFLLLASFGALGQSRTMYVGDVELRLGMSRDAAMKALSNKYTVAAMGTTSFSVTEYNERTKYHDMLGVVGFENNELTYVSRSMDTSAWPNDEGFAIGRAIYDAMSGSIPVTDADGAKRATARIVMSSDDTSRPRGNLKTIDVYINDRKISIFVSDTQDGKTVNATVAIRAKPW